MATAERRVTYRSDSPDVLGEALLAVIRHARTSTDSFTFAPLKLSSLERDGLTIQGADLTGLQAVLAEIPGLVIEPS